MKEALEMREAYKVGADVNPAFYWQDAEYMH